MDDLYEAAVSEDNDLDNRSIEEADEAALYSLVHHSEDTFETGMLDLSENYISQRNKACRWDSVKRITDMNQGNYITPTPVNNQNFNYMSLNNNIASTSGYRPGKTRHKRGHWLKDTWNVRRYDKPWNIQDRVRNLYSKHTNLVPIHVEHNPMRPMNDQEQLKGDNSIPFHNSVNKKNSHEILHKNSNLYHNNTNDIHNKQSDVLVDKEQSKNVSGSVLENERGMSNKESNNFDIVRHESIHVSSDHLVNKNTNKSSREKSTENQSHEVLIVSDTEDCNHASDESIVEVSIPPKPLPVLIALDSSDESDSIVSMSKPVLNITGIKEGMAREKQENNEKSEHMANGMCVTSMDLLSGDSKERKKNKKKKREKHVKSIECIRWTTGMIKFYNHSWGGETYDHLKLQQEMTNNPTKWKILDVDKHGPLKNYGPLARVRCANCHQLGHMAKQCPDPKKIKCCSMCGQQGHVEHQCPNKICFKCGRPAPLFNNGCPSCWKKDHPNSCSACGDQDHYTWLCPDVWRKFHSVTTPEEVKSTELQAPQYKTDKDLACCYCAGRGHTATQCPYLSKQSGSRSSNSTIDILSTINIINSKKRKKKRNSFFDGKNRQEFNRKRRKTN